MSDIGVDLAWGARAWTGLARLDGDGRLLEAFRVRSDEQIVHHVREWAGAAALVAIDAPLIVRNASGARPCERLMGRYFGRFHAAPYPANTENPAFRDGARALRLARALGLEVGPDSTAPRRAIEVYPHPAIVSLFDLPRVLTYKQKPGRDLAHLRAELLRLLDLLEGAARHDVPVFVADCPDWLAIRRQVETATRASQLGAVEDAVDAVVCAYIARCHRLRPDLTRTFGDGDTGYIVTPVTKAIARVFDDDRAEEARRAGAGPGEPLDVRAILGSDPMPEPVIRGKLLLDIDITAPPVTLATGGGAALATEVRTAAAAFGRERIDTRFGLALEFRTPPREGSADAWDLRTLVDAMLDALTAVLGRRSRDARWLGGGHERVGYLVAAQRTVRTADQQGARIRLYDLRG